MTGPECSRSTGTPTAAKRQSAGLGNGVRTAGAAGQAADADAVEPGARTGGRDAVAKLLAELHPDRPHFRTCPVSDMWRIGICLVLLGPIGAEQLMARSGKPAWQEIFLAI